MPNMTPQERRHQIDEHAKRIVLEREEREAKEKVRLANKARCEYLLKLNDLGLHEQVILHASPKGILPTTQVVPLSAEHAREARKMIDQSLAELAGIQVADSTLLGPDGSPL